MLASRRQRLPVITPTAASTRPRRGASASTATKTIEKHKLEDNEDYVAETAEYTAPAKKKSKQGRARNGATVTPSNSLPDSLSNSNGTPQNINEPRPIQFWLMKAEPEERFEKGVDVSYSIDALAAAKSPEPWEGVRNYTARNNIKQMKKGDLAFFYHSSCKTPGIVGMMEIIKEASVDETAFDPDHPYFDPKSDRDNPKWYLVHVEFRQKFLEALSLTQLKEFGGPGRALENMQLLRQSRLSVSKVEKAEWDFIMDRMMREPEST